VFKLNKEYMPLYVEDMEGETIYDENEITLKV